MDKKYIIGIIFILLAVGVYFGGKSVLDISCDGWNVINPICWLGRVVDVGLEVVSFISAIFLVVVGGLIMLLDTDSLKYIFGFAMFGLAAIILWIVPDPLPFVDELVTTAAALYYGYKMLGSSGGDKLEMF